jgi:hypothetical protein
MRPNGSCRSCLAPIRWVLTGSGKRMPLDTEAVPDGNVTVDRYEADHAIVVVHATPADVPASEALRYKSHFATCPEADSWRHPKNP